MKSKRKVKAAARKRRAAVMVARSQLAEVQLPPSSAGESPAQFVRRRMRELS